MNDAPPGPIVSTTLLEKPFQVDGPAAFEALALELFRLHARHNPVYGEYLHALRIDPASVEREEQIPFLPIGLFRNKRVLLEGLDADLQFTSSGTTGATTSTHHVPWSALYERSFNTSFGAEYGRPSRWRILALLPAYLERPGSSLVYMVEKLIAQTGDAKSGTWLHDLDGLAALLRQSEEEGVQTLLFGVPFALLDLAEKHPMPLPNTVIMETGGMKGRRPEMVREELHGILKEAFGVPAIHSEYGMTELLSQAWSQGNGAYRCPPWMKVLTRDVNDPFTRTQPGRTGGIDVIDLCNIASCPFISTQDLGRVHPDGSFEVLGRFDHSDLRGCNLLVG
ncbi:MAG TPA: acyl transferase [Flavobacteriales bacterium]|mgnify:CR=1 FL=1|nr:acyl transferase [Flavobacteriales bacterium]